MTAKLNLKAGMCVAVVGTLQSTSHREIKDRLSALDIQVGSAPQADLLLLGKRAGKAAEVAGERGILQVEEESFLAALRDA